MKVSRIFKARQLPYPGECRLPWSAARAEKERDEGHRAAPPPRGSSSKAPASYHRAAEHRGPSKDPARRRGGRRAPLLGPLSPPHGSHSLAGKPSSRRPERRAPGRRAAVSPLLTGPSGRAAAQCPEGSPRGCRRGPGGDTRGPARPGPTRPGLAPASAHRDRDRDAAGPAAFSPRRPPRGRLSPGAAGWARPAASLCAAVNLAGGGPVRCWGCRGLSSVRVTALWMRKSSQEMTLPQTVFFFPRPNCWIIAVSSRNVGCWTAACATVPLKLTWLQILPVASSSLPPLPSLLVSVPGTSSVPSVLLPWRWQHGWNAAACRKSVTPTPAPPRI